MIIFENFFSGRSRGNYQGRTGDNYQGGARNIDKVRSHLIGVHAELARLFAELQECKDRECRDSIRHKIAFEKETDTLLENARDHITLGTWFRRASECSNVKCEEDAQLSIKSLQQSIERRKSGKGGSTEVHVHLETPRRSKEEKSEKERESKPFDESKLTTEQRTRRLRLLRLSEHFHKLGDLYGDAADCLDQKCRDGSAVEIKYLKKEGKWLRDQTAGKSVPQAVRAFQRRMKAKYEQHARVHSLYQRAGMCSNKKCLRSFQRLIQAVERTHLAKPEKNIGARLKQITR